MEVFTMHEICNAFNLRYYDVANWRARGVLPETKTHKQGVPTELDIQGSFVLLMVHELRRCGFSLDKAGFLARHAWNIKPSDAEIFVVSGANCGFVKRGAPISDFLFGGASARVIDVGEIILRLARLYRPN